jgi:hypothetical protein
MGPSKHGGYMTPLTVANGILLALGSLALGYFLVQLLSMTVIAWVDSLPEPELSKEAVEFVNAISAVGARADQRLQAIEDAKTLGQLEAELAEDWRKRN